MPATRVLIFANRTALDRAVFEAVRGRAANGPVSFHLVVPATPHGLDRVLNPDDSGIDEAQDQLRRALPILTAAAGQRVTGSVGDPDPLNAVQDALNLLGFDEVILSTLPVRFSRWLRVDLPHKVRALGKPMMHVTGTGTSDAEADLMAGTAK
jgi:hypothetical protein